jgi:hypothetical protein
LSTQFKTTARYGDVSTLEDRLQVVRTGTEGFGLLRAEELDPGRLAGRSMPVGTKTAACPTRAM